jgi:undecaprenyldiphospho-muramoylpentapeptide beta-N-acetylglucosaminyltransferase
MRPDPSTPRTGRSPESDALVRAPGGTYCLVAGGGTAGHLQPGLAIARALTERGHDAATIRFVTSEREIDAQLLAPTTFDVSTLPGRGIQRRLTLQNLSAAFGLFRAQVRAFGLLRRHRPRVVLAVGGYASVACAVAAVVLRIPLVVAEQNARAGLANRLTGRFARVCAVPVADTDLPRAVVTGNPVRAEVLGIDRARDRTSARAALGLPADRTVVLVFAGSLGSRRLNEAVRGLVGEWARRDDLAIRHVVGGRDWEELGRPTAAEDPSGLLYQPVRYEDRMHLALAATDLVVCRAGGTTVAELAIVGLPAVLVPLPIATRDHQTANAREMVRAGAARLVPDAELDVARLERELGEIVDGPGKLAAMTSAAAGLGRPDAAGRVARLVEEQA